jgi:hypothetical protein
MNARTQRLAAENLEVAVKLEKKAKLEALSATQVAEKEKQRAENERGKAEVQRKKAEEAKKVALRTSRSPKRQSAVEPKDWRKAKRKLERKQTNYVLRNSPPGARLNWQRTRKKQNVKKRKQNV